MSPWTGANIFVLPEPHDETCDPNQRGLFPPADSGYPRMLAATHPMCGYAWGEGDARHVLAVALAMKSAEQLGQSKFVGTPDALPSGPRELIAAAKEQLTTCLEIRKRIKDPRTAAAREAQTDLENGILLTGPFVLREPAPIVNLSPSPPSLAHEERRAFDVFLSHNSRDKPTVRLLAEVLRAHGLRVWFDEWELVPGRPWQEFLEDIIKTVNSAAVLVGRDGLGPWENHEMRSCLSEFIERGISIIPILLPGAKEPPALPIFLKPFTWVDLRDGITEKGLDLIKWGVTGAKPIS